MPLSKHDHPKANRVFTNREKPIAQFNAARANLAPDGYRVLVFHGVGGQGKTALRKHLADTVLAGEDPRQAVWGVLNCEVFPDAARGLLELRKTLRASGPIRCTAFDVAIAVYWEKAYPTEDASKALKDLLTDYEGVLGSVADNAPAWLALAESLPAGMGLGFKALNFARKKLKDRAAKRQVEALDGIEQLDATALLDKLPYFLAADLRAHCEHGDRQPVIFLDTYEALWSDKPDKTGLAALETDAWVRELVAAAPGVLFVVLGRDALTWARRFPQDGWGGCLDQQLLSGLAQADADYFLRQIPVDESDIRAAMIEAAQAGGPDAHPFYLDLSAETYLARKAQGQDLNPAQFTGTHSKIISRFLRHRSTAEQATLKALSEPRSFDRDLFRALVEQRQTGYPPDAWAEFCGFSFIETGPDGRQRLHGLMRKHLQAEQDAQTRAELQAFLFDWFDARCQAATPKDLTPAHDHALHEAVYHRDLADAVAALAWFWERVTVFYNAARYAAIEPLHRWALGVAEHRFGDGQPETAVALNNLAQLLKATNRLAEAEPLYRRALAMDEQSFGPEHPKVAIRLNNLATLLQATNRLADAEPLMRRGLAIDEQSLGLEHPSVARDLNNLAALLLATHRRDEAEPLMRRVVEIFEKSHGLEHPNVATTLNNLAQLLKATNRLDEAEPLMRRALAIDEQSFGLEHPKVAISLNNLARLLQDTSRLAEAEPLMRRALVIMLTFTRATGHEHPHLRAAFGNYQILLEALPLTDAERADYLAGLGAEAGFDSDAWRQYL